MAGVVALATALALAGCSSAEERTVRNREYVEREAVSFSISLPSGRVVECVAFGESVTCDWGSR